MADTGFFSSFVDNVAFQSWINQPHTVLLVSDQFIYDLNTTTNYNQIPPAAILASAALNNRQVESGVITADAVTFVNIQPGTPSYIVIRNDSTNELVVAFADVNGLNMTGSNMAELHWNDCGIAAL